MLGEIIKQLRTENKITQRQLGEIANVSQQAVGKWEKGIAEPDSFTIKKLAEYFDVSVDYLLGHSSKKKEAKPLAVSDEELSLTKRLLIEKIKQMDDTTIAALDALASQILDKRGK